MRLGSRDFHSESCCEPRKNSRESPEQRGRDLERRPWRDAQCVARNLQSQTRVRPQLRLVIRPHPQGRSRETQRVVVVTDASGSSAGIERTVGPAQRSTLDMLPQAHGVWPAVVCVCQSVRALGRARKAAIVPVGNAGATEAAGRVLLLLSDHRRAGELRMDLPRVEVDVEPEDLQHLGITEELVAHPESLGGQGALVALDRLQQHARGPGHLQHLGREQALEVARLPERRLSCRVKRIHHRPALNIASVTLISPFRKSVHAMLTKWYWKNRVPSADHS